MNLFDLRAMPPPANWRWISMQGLDFFRLFYPRVFDR